MSREQVAAEAMQHEWVQRCIDEQIGNFGASDAAEVSDYVRARFEDFAYTVGLMALGESVTPIQLDEPWRARFQVDIDEIFDEGTEVDEFIRSAGVASWYDEALTVELPRLRDHPLTNLAFTKIANRIAKVAYVIDQGLDPSIVVPTSEQQYLQLADLAHRLETLDPDSVIRLDNESDDPTGDVLNTLSGLEAIQRVGQITAGVADGLQDPIRYGVVAPEADSGEEAENDES